MLATHRHVAVVAANLDLRALGNRVTVLIHAQDHRGFGAAVTDCLELLEVIRPRQQVLAAFERLALVQEYFRAAGNFDSLETETVHGLPRPQDDKYAQQRAFSDPVFAVRAVAAG